MTLVRRAALSVSAAALFAQLSAAAVFVVGRDPIGPAWWISLTYGVPLALVGIALSVAARSRPAAALAVASLGVPFLFVLVLFGLPDAIASE
jgi:hypothetical protein